MCGRYTLFTDEEYREIQEIVHEVERKYGKDSIHTGEIFPTNPAPVLLEKAGRIEAEPVGWGFPNFARKGVIINARSETAPEKKIFASPLAGKRCVIPSTGFYEWGPDKTKYRFRLPGEDALYMVGLYNEFKGERRFVILTTAANPSIADIHDRMPVVLPKDRVSEWLMSTEYAMRALSEVPPELERIIA